MLRAAVFGSPVAHSLSPVLHHAAYAALGLDDWTYVRREVTEVELPGVVGALDDEWRGLSLTMPLKEAAFDVAASVTDVAREAGAINTLVRREDGRWDGANTDVIGIVRAVEHVAHEGAALLLGSGATSRSAALALVDLGVRDVVVAARNADAAQEVVTLLERHDVTAMAIPLAVWAREPRRLVISTLPPAASSATAAGLDSVAQQKWHEATLLDVVYADWPTPLAQAAVAHGSEVISGLDMLVHQAAEQVRLFTGQRPPVEAMFDAAREAMASR
ncbi:shikimate dehydrogenase [Knoellia subterranea]|uniref:Shikimate dehydrogenase n=1 Tax=Knoellia subterranea KCTC 19937 TaxID=1385521 RepID=A0A0A0JJ74_9MICO|nr:shikimate dehydrogenase [Knoellia subterranea]KGN36092.1 shikimate dehydrogenase [Knoellia subterranea KCTC 19937]